MSQPALRSTSWFVAAAVVAGCSPPPPADMGPCAAAGITAESRFASGSREGHADPLGARAAGQARAGRIHDPAQIRQPDDARHVVRVGDFVIANEKIAAYIEAEGESDGYSAFGGEILALETVGEDGRPTGISQYGETLLAISKQGVNPDSITVIQDGSDGKAAIIRVSGRLANLPFLDTLSAFFPQEFNLPAALDYVLEPGSEKITVRLSLMNPDKEEVQLSTFQNIGFFQSARSRLFTAASGYAVPKGEHPWVAFDGGRSAFAWRMPGAKMKFFIEVSGFQFFTSSGLSVDGCGKKTLDYVELIPGAPGIDGALAALRRVDGDATWREVRGKVVDGGGATIGGALVHVMAADGRYVTRAVSDPGGKFLLHLPPGAMRLAATMKGYIAQAPVDVAPMMNDLTIKLAANGSLLVTARDQASKQPLPVRVQVIPTNAPVAAPAEWGVSDETRGRIHQEFAVTGEARLTLPPGEHQVVVSRGYEWEIHQQKLTIEAGKQATVDASLLHSVDSTGVMCADFHIHSFYSADSSDPVEYKVRGAIADGLEIPVSSEHEWIIDFQPTIQKLGLTKWAYGFPSEEFTTFTWGHFGIIPIRPRPEAVNNGAVAWIGKKPPEVFQTIADLPEKPVLIINHPSGGGFGAYFSSTHFDRATGAGDPEWWSDKFGAVEVFNDSDFDANRDKSVADWFALLNAGKIVWAVGSSDSHSLRSSPVGYPRTCMPFGHDDPTRLSAEAVRDVLARGAATVSGGLYMAVTGPGGVGPGGMVMQKGPFPVQVVVQAPKWLEATTLEVIVDGETVDTIQLQESMGALARRYEATVMVSAKQPRALHWVVFHASAKGRDLAPVSPGRKAFGVSNPILF
ncbi:MAG: hypothetical protein EXR72_07695 [Myxococcales bacterium]|nr:hypothetical protein [Myxococcales bacterium]